jgi:hypothetical protein
MVLPSGPPSLQVLSQDAAIVHSVELIAAENDVVVERTLEEITHVLPHGVCGSLGTQCDPVGVCCVASISTKLGVKLSKLECGIDVLVQGHTVELGRT